jgi:hypothetical protein
MAVSEAASSTPSTSLRACPVAGRQKDSRAEQRISSKIPRLLLSVFVFLYSSVLAPFSSAYSSSPDIKKMPYATEASFGEQNHRFSVNLLSESAEIGYEMVLNGLKLVLTRIKDDVIVTRILKNEDLEINRVSIDAVKKNGVWIRIAGQKYWLFYEAGNLRFISQRHLAAHKLLRRNLLRVDASASLEDIWTATLKTAVKATFVGRDYRLRAAYLPEGEIVVIDVKANKTMTIPLKEIVSGYAVVELGGEKIKKKYHVYFDPGRDEIVFVSLASSPLDPSKVRILVV